MELGSGPGGAGSAGDVGFGGSGLGASGLGHGAGSGDAVLELPGLGPSGFERGLEPSDLEPDLAPGLEPGLEPSGLEPDLDPSDLDPSDLDPSDLDVADEDLRRLFSPALVPLPPRPGTFERIASRARRRRLVRSGATIASVTVAVAAIGFTGLTVRRHDAQVSQTLSLSASPMPNAAVPRMACAAADLTVTTGDQISGPTRTGVLLVVANRSAAPCRLAGYPAVSLRPVADTGAVTGSALVATDGGTRLTADAGVRTLTLRPGEEAFAGLEWPASTRECRGTAMAARIRITVTMSGKSVYSGDQPSGQSCAPADLAVTAWAAGSG